MRKYLKATLAVAVVIMMLLSACGGAGGSGAGNSVQSSANAPSSQANDANNNAPAADSGAITISFLNGFTGGDGSFMRIITNGFNDSQDKYFINEMQETDHYTKFKAGDYDLVVMAADQLPTYVGDGWIQSAEPIYQAAGISINDFHPAAAPIVTIDGVLSAFSLDIHPLTMFYNKTLTEEAPKNLEEIIALNTKLQETSKDLYAMAIPGAGLSEWYMLTMAIQNGAEMSDGRQMIYNTDKFADAMLQLNDLIFKHKVSPANLGLDGEFKAFMQDVEGAASMQAAFALTGPWFYSAAQEKFGDDLGLGIVPTIGAQGGVFGGGHTIAVSAKVTDQAKLDGITEFFKYLYTPENLLNWAESGQAPTHKATMEMVNANTGKYPLAAANSKQFDNMKIFPLYAFQEQGRYLRENVYSIIVTTEGLTKEQLMPELDKATEFAKQVADEK